MLDQSGQRHESAHGEADTPVVVGYASRLPGARGPDEMWRVLREGRCTVSSIRNVLFDPALYFDPRQTVRGKSYTFAAGQIEDVFHFDPAFFGITPREAAQMDPQQRLMLQTSWEAIEHAGLRVDTLAGDRTGVYVGASIVENLSPFYFDTARGDSPFNLGNELSIIANRVSATFDFGGPSYVLDTACASGLYALHHATEALRRKEIDTAIVGGVHVLQAPGGFVGFSQARMLSPSGLCQAFDESADGYVRSEACIVLVLQRPDVAARLMARPRARLLATGVNTDAGASPLTVPSAARQEALIDTVLSRSGRDPEDFAFFEAHGTGTQIGDPVEARSISRAVASLRRTPLLIGSAKTNFGHPEPAAGLLGLLKATLALENRAMPASLHFRKPNPNIDFDGLNLSVNTGLTALDPAQGPLVAGVNSFGFGGTNVTAILEAADQTSRPTHLAVPDLPASITATDRSAEPSTRGRWLLVSAESESSLGALAGAWADRLENTSKADWPALAAASAHRRAALSLRLALPLRDETPTDLRAFARGTPSESAVHNTCTLSRARTVFAFPGNGAQFAGMGRAQYRDDPIFRQAFEACAAAFRAHDIPGLGTQLMAPDLDEHLGGPCVGQPLLFSFQIALVRSLEAAGLRADALIGHSMGEIAALHVAGAIDLATATHIVASRSRAFDTLRGAGTMATVAASEADVERAIGGLGENGPVIAAINSPRSITVSGSSDSIERLSRVTVGGKRLAMVRLDVQIPYHGPYLDDLHNRLIADMADRTFSQATLPVASSTLGRLLRAGECNADYFWRNARDPVRFMDALKALAQTGPCQIVEISPKAVLKAIVRDIARYSNAQLEHFTVIEDPKAISGEPASRIAARAWASGINIDGEALSGPKAGHIEGLPLYPWDEAEHGVPLSPDGLDGWGEAGTRSLAGRRPDRSVAAWMAEFSPVHPAWVADHVVGGQVVLPATALVEMVLSAGAELWPGAPLELRDFEILCPAVVQGDGIRIRTQLDEATGAISMAMRPRLSSESWASLARGTLHRTAAMPEIPVCRPPANVSNRTELPYAFLEERGLVYGPAFRRLDTVQRQGQTLWLDLTTSKQEGPSFTLDPMAVDAVFHGIGALARDLQGGSARLRTTGRHGALLAQQIAGGNSLFPTRIGSIHLCNAGQEPVRARLDVTRFRPRSMTVDVTLFGADDAAIAHCSGVELSVVRLAPEKRKGPVRTTLRRATLRMPGQRVRLPRGWTDPELALRRLKLDPTPEPTKASAAFAGLHNALKTGSPEERACEAIAELLHVAPNLCDDARAIMARTRGHPDKDLALHSDATRLVRETIAEIALPLIAKWRPGERLDLLLSGVIDATLLRRLSCEPRVDRVAVLYTGAEDLAVLKHALPDDLRPLLAEYPAAGAFDLVLSSNTEINDNPDVQDFLAPGGLALCFDTPDLIPHAGGDQSRHPEGWLARYRNGGQLPVRVSAYRRAAASLDDRKHVPTVAVAEPIPENLPNSGKGLKALVATDPANPDHRVMVHVHGRDDDPARTLGDVLMRLRRVTQIDDTPLVLVCLDASAGQDFTVLTAGLSSAMRSLRNEMPDRRVTLVAVSDLPKRADSTLWAEILHATTQELVLHVDQTGITVERLSPAMLATLPKSDCHLVIETPGKLDRLSWAPAKRVRPGLGEVEIAVTATGLNFRDVMWARGLLPERMFDGSASGGQLGMECAGVITRVGPQARLASGTEVMAFAPGAFATKVVVPETSAVRLPRGMSPVEGATLPVVFSTAWEALVRLAHIRTGESVLIHGAAGGVGLAAIQIAKLHGANVFATAGTPEKRAIVRAAGAVAVFDSRDTGFQRGIETVTEGRGVDIVLNCLAGEAMQRSVACLAPFGRFVELGKRDYLEGTRLDLRPFAANLSYFGLDLDQVMTHAPHRVLETMEAIRAAFEAGDLHPLPVTTFDARSSQDAFRHMLASHHVGKIAMTPPKRRRQSRPRPIRDDWVIAGGNGGVGLAVARLLLEEGANHVHVICRSGAIPQGAGNLGAWACNVEHLTFRAIDAADKGSMHAFFGDLIASGRRIGGVIHAAMVLRDRLIQDLDPVEVSHVIRPKLTAARAIDQALRALPEQPDHVVFFSSVAARLGNPGQIGYSAANAAMEAVTRARRRDGLPGLSIAWGAIADEGYLTRNAALSLQLSRLDGFGLLRMEEVLAELKRALRTPPAEDYCFAAIDWSALAPSLPALATRTFSRLVPPGAPSAQPVRELIETVRQLEWPAAISLVERELREIVSSIMRLPPDQLDMRRPLGSYGIDSLMAMELRLEVEARFGQALPVFSLTDQMSVSYLATSMVTRLHTDGDNVPTSGTTELNPPSVNRELVSG